MKKLILIPLLLLAVTAHASPASDAALDSYRKQEQRHLTQRLASNSGTVRTRLRKTAQREVAQTATEAILACLESTCARESASNQ